MRTPLSVYRKRWSMTRENLERRFKLVSAFSAEGFGNQDAAIRELQTIIELDPDNIVALTQLAHFYKKVWRYDPQPPVEKNLRT